MKPFVKRTFAAGLALVLMLSAGACRKEEQETVTEEPDYVSMYSETTLTIGEDGTVSEVIVEKEGEGFVYSDFETFVRGNIKAYGKGAELLQIKEDEGTVRAAIVYDDLDTYNDFNNVYISIEKAEQSALGTESDALATGNDAALDEAEKTGVATFTDASGSEVNENDALSGGGFIVTCDIPVTMKISGASFRYTDSHCTIISDDTARFSGNGTSRAIYK